MAIDDVNVKRAYMKKWEENSSENIDRGKWEFISLRKYAVQLTSEVLGDESTKSLTSWWVIYITLYIFV